MKTKGKELAEMERKLSQKGKGKGNKK